VDARPSKKKKENSLKGGKKGNGRFEGETKGRESYDGGGGKGTRPCAFKKKKKLKAKARGKKGLTRKKVEMGRTGVRMETWETMWKVPDGREGKGKGERAVQKLIQGGGKRGTTRERWVCTGKKTGWGSHPQREKKSRGSFGVS